MSSPKPHIIVVMGSFQIPYHYRFLKESLQRGGYSVTVVNLVSTSRTPIPNVMEKEIAAIRAAVKEQMDAGHDVVVMAHSQGGVSASGAMEGLVKTGSAPGVIHIVYLAAFLVEPGQSTVEKGGGQQPPWLEIRDGLQIPHDNRNIFFNDLPEDLAADSEKYILPNSRSITEGIISYVPWNDIPATYIICDKDNAILPAVAEYLISSCKVRCGVVRIDAGHMPHLSVPEQLAAIIRWAAGEKGVDLEGIKFDERVSTAQGGTFVGWSKG